MVARGVEAVALPASSGFLLGPNDPGSVGACRRCLVAPRGCTPGPRQGNRAGDWVVSLLGVGLVLQGGALVVDVIAAGCPSGGRAAARGGRDQVWPESRRQIKTFSRWLPCHDARSTDGETPGKEILIAASANCKALEEKGGRADTSLETRKARARPFALSYPCPVTL